MFDYCWGQKLSTIIGGNWQVDRRRYQMVGRLYYHYKPVPIGTPHAVSLGDHAFSKDAAQCAGDFTLAR